MKGNQGFTLVELAIVLVIIGLIVSSVLVGQDLIRSAELRSVTRQYQAFQAAVNTFIGKYNGIPGDIQGESYGVESTSTGLNGSDDGHGDGDGALEDDAGSGAVADDLNGEVLDFWHHLTADGRELIPGTYVGGGSIGATVGVHIPAMSFGNYGWGVFYSGSKNHFITGVSGTDYDTASVFIPVDAFNIDSKIDDGAPSSGIVQARGPATDSPDTAATSITAENSAYCINDTTTAVYQFTATAPQCTLRFEMSTF